MAKKGKGKGKGGKAKAKEAKAKEPFVPPWKLGKPTWYAQVGVLAVPQHAGSWLHNEEYIWCLTSLRAGTGKRNDKACRGRSEPVEDRNLGGGRSG